MTTADMRDEITRRINGLPDQRLQSVLDFVGYVEQIESQHATSELTAIPGFNESMRRGQAEIREGNTVDYRRVRNDV